MRYSTEHRQKTRERILREAANEVRAKGPDGVAVAGLMARAGLTHGGFYAHFSSKEALIAEAVDTMFADARARAKGLEGSADPKAALRDYVDFYLSEAHRDGRSRGCPLPALAGDIARSPDVAGPHFAEGIATLTVRLEALLTQIGIALPEAEAKALLAQLVGAVVLARAVPDPVQSGSMLSATRDCILAKYGLAAA